MENTVTHSQKIFSVRDVKMNKYGSPVLAPNHAVMLRGITDAMADPNMEFSKHPNDYQLFELGEFYPETGEIIAHEKPEFKNELNELIGETQS